MRASGSRMVRADPAGDPGAQLGGGLAAEGQDEDLLGVDAGLDARGDRLDDRRRLAGARPGQHEQRAAGMVDDGLLGGVQLRSGEARTPHRRRAGRPARSRSPVCHPPMEARPPTVPGRRGAWVSSGSAAFRSPDSIRGPPPSSASPPPGAAASRLVEGRRRRAESGPHRLTSSRSAGGDRQRDPEGSGPAARTSGQPTAEADPAVAHRAPPRRRAAPAARRAPARRPTRRPAPPGTRAPRRRRRTAPAPPGAGRCRSAGRSAP